MNKVIILGAGPAGLTAAIYAGRAFLNPLVIVGPEPGGQLIYTTEVENYPGFDQGIMGPDLVIKMRKQAEKFGAKFVETNVTSVDLKTTPFIIQTQDQKYECQALIIATGSRSKLLGLPNESKYISKGVHVCATCDGAFYRDKLVAIVGGGESAMVEALFLTKFANQVLIINRSNQLSATAEMKSRINNNDKISVVFNSEVVEYCGTSKLEAIKIIDKKTQNIFEQKIDGLFLAIGYTPNTEIFRNQIELDKNGRIITKNIVFTSNNGIFAAGDVTDIPYRQAITAAGLGCMAGIEVEKYLQA